MEDSTLWDPDVAYALVTNMTLPKDWELLQCQSSTELRMQGYQCLIAVSYISNPDSRLTYSILIKNHILGGCSAFPGTGTQVYEGVEGRQGRQEGQKVKDTEFEGESFHP